MSFVKQSKFKLLSSGLLPIFLFMAAAPVLATPKASGTDPVAVLFGVQSAADELLSKYNLDSAQIIFDKHGLPKTYKASVSAEQYLKMRSDPGFSYVELNSKVFASQLSITPLVTTNDPFFTTSLIEDRQWYLPKIKIPEAWQFSKGSFNVKVAVIDTGIHASHLDLNDGRVVEGFDVTKGRPILGNTNSDDNGHGTAVAGVIGAIPNNSRGVAGVNWNVSIMPVKALNSDGTGDIGAVAQAIVWAADNGASIINLSLGGPGFGNDQTLNNSIIYAFNKGALIISAAGNDLADQGVNLDTSPVYPVCSDGGSNMVIGVAASDINDRKASFSNFSINCVDIVAPGKKIVTTAFLPSDPSNNILIYGSGTSLATPIVSGVAALLKASNPSLSNAQIRDIILKTADNIDPLNQDNCLNSSCNGFLGKGRINAFSALTPTPILSGSLVREAATGRIYQVAGGVKRYVSDFVFRQRGFVAANVINESSNQLVNYTPGPALPPLEGTLIKAQTDPTVYVIHQEFKRPLTYLVFQSRNYSFANVQVLPDADVNAMTAGDWYWPPDGTMVLIKGNPTVYVMHEQLARPTTYFVFIQRKLSFARVVSVTADEFSHIPRPKDPYWLPPLEGTLIKAQTDPTVFVVENGTRRALSGQAFIARGYRFANIKTLPDAEVAVIAPGQPILN